MLRYFKGSEKMLRLKLFARCFGLFAWVFFLVLQYVQTYEDETD